MDIDLQDIADFMTKPFTIEKNIKFRDLAGVFIPHAYSFVNLISDISFGEYKSKGGVNFCS